MEEVIRKEILYDVSEAIKILEVKEERDFELLEKLSNHAIEDVALHKDVDIITITVLLYSLYKTAERMTQKDYDDILKHLKRAHDALEQNEFGRYNEKMKTLYKLIRKCNAQVKEHLQDVMDAARIKKGTILLSKGLSIGQAAGLMGLSNWDLQAYAGKTTALGEHQELVRAEKRMKTALKLFGVS